MDTVIALRRPEDYSPDQGARFEIHFEKLRNRVDGLGALPFEARVESVVSGIRWLSSDLKPPLLMQAAELFADGLAVAMSRQPFASARARRGGFGCKLWRKGLFRASRSCRKSSFNDTRLSHCP